MCSNYRNTKPLSGVRAEFAQAQLPILSPSLHGSPNLEPRLEIRPTNLAVVLRKYNEGVELTRLRWGLLPWFHHGDAKAWKFATFNARAETVKAARSFRDPFQRRRCLIAGDGWVEWKGQGTPKPKFYIDRVDGAPICFAGLWDRCDTETGPIESFTMVTQPPGALSDLHDRAPVVLLQADWARWLDITANVDDLLTAAPLDHYRVRSFADSLTSGFA